MSHRVFLFIRAVKYGQYLSVQICLKSAVFCFGNYAAFHEDIAHSYVIPSERHIRDHLELTG